MNSRKEKPLKAIGKKFDLFLLSSFVSHIPHDFYVGNKTNLVYEFISIIKHKLLYAFCSLSPLTTYSFEKWKKKKKNENKVVSLSTGKIPQKPEISIKIARKEISFYAWLSSTVTSADDKLFLVIVFIRFVYL